MQPGIQPLVTPGADTQPNPAVRAAEPETAPARVVTPTHSAPSAPFWRGVVAASIVVLVISAILAGILLILPATH